MRRYQVMPLIRNAILAAMAGCLTAPWLWAQDDALPLPLAADEETVEVIERTPLVQAAIDSIEAQSPNTPAARLRAVHILQRMGAIADAQRYLEEVTGATLSDEDLIEVHRDLGTASLMQIATNRELGPEAGALVRSVFAAVRQANQDPARLQQLVATLASEDRETRRQALRGLGQAGATVVPVLLEAYRNPPRGVAAKDLTAAVRLLGRRAEDGLIAALSSPDLQLQAAAAHWLGTIAAPGSAIHLWRPAHSTDRQLQTIARQSLEQMAATLPSATEAADRLARRARSELLGERPRPTAEGVVELWTWSVEQDNIVQHRLAGDEAHAVHAARLARDAMELNASEEHGVLLLTAVLHVDQLLGGLDQRLPQGDGTAAALAREAGFARVRNVLELALEHQLHAAAQGATELWGDLGTAASLQTDGEPSALVRALHSPSRRVRYGAARAVMTLDPRQSYPGASHLVETLVELAAAQGRPRALLLTPRQDTAGQLQGLLGSMGFVVDRAQGTRDLLRKAVSSSDADVVLVSDSVSPLSADEVIQQLRKDAQSALLPVVLLVRQGRYAAGERLVARHVRVFSMPEFTSFDVLGRTLSQAEQSVQHLSVSAENREAQAFDALSWLAHVAQYAESYPFYDVMRARSIAVEGTYQEALAEPSISLLGALGDQVAQTRLLAMVRQEGLQLEHRQQAATALSESVKRRGLMLTRTELAQLRRPATNPAEQEIYDQMIEALQLQTRNTSTTR